MIIFQLLFFVWIATSSSLFGWSVTAHATVYFSPDDQLEKRVIDLIEQEKRSIHICLYSFTHRTIANALIDAYKRGVEVEVIVDRFSVKIKSPLKKLSEAGIPVFVWDPDRLRKKQAHRPLMHNKFCVFGLDKVWTGSFNFTYESSKIHQENVVILEDASLASAFKGQFHTIKLRSCLPYNYYVAMLPKRKISSRHKR